MELQVEQLSVSFHRLAMKRALPEELESLAPLPSTKMAKVVGASTMVVLNYHEPQRPLLHFLNCCSPIVFNACVLMVFYEDTADQVWNNNATPELNTDCIISILEWLPTPSDVVRLRTVCSEWNNMIPEIVRTVFGPKFRKSQVCSFVTRSEEEYDLIKVHCNVTTMVDCAISVLRHHVLAGDRNRAKKDQNQLSSIRVSSDTHIEIKDPKRS
jgi:hypothetical protein